MKEATLQNRSKHAAFSRLHRISVNNSGLEKMRRIFPQSASGAGYPAEGKLLKNSFPLAR
jgi:hypothetical protein